MHVWTAEYGMSGSPVDKEKTIKLAQSVS
jgi:hypothetical protein